MTLPYQLDRIITIAAPRETVFSFFTDNDRWAAWWGSRWWPSAGRREWGT